MGTSSAPRNLVVVSDTHVGCQLALCPKTARLDNGAPVGLNAVQRHINELWAHFWHKWIPSVVGKERYDVVVNGDAIDGVHHNSTHQWSHSLSDQAAAAEMLLAPVVDACKRSGGRFYMIRGTEAHTGVSGTEEEKLAKTLGACPAPNGQYARNELWKRVGSGMVHLLHHIGTTGSQAYESSAILKELVEAYNESARWREVAPDGIVRSHRHRCLHIKLPAAHGNAFSITTPGWQAKTPFAYKIAGARQSRPQFGGIIIRDAGGAEGLYARTFVETLGREAAE